MKKIYAIVCSEGVDMLTPTRDMARRLKLSDEAIVTIPVSRAIQRQIAATTKRLAKNTTQQEGI